MRFARLDLTRFGHFQDSSFDFGAAPEAGTPDFHVLYGSNEAGKTTLFNAVARLLYGYPRSNLEGYDFKFGQDLSVGARIEGVGAANDLVVHRIKKGNAFLDAQGRAVASDILVPHLQGMDQQTWERVFSLGLKQLERGAQDIKEAGGEAGRLFFAAHSGLSGLTSMLEAHEEAVGRIYKASGKNQEIPQLRRRISEIDAKLRDITLLPESYRALTDAVEEAGRLFRQKDDDLQRHIYETAEMERRLELEKQVATLEEIDLDLEPMAGLPDWREDPVPDSLGKLRSDLIEAQTRIDGHQARIDKIEAEISDLSLDETLLSEVKRIDSLADGRAAAYNAHANLSAKLHDIVLKVRDLFQILRSIVPEARREDTRSWVLPAVEVAGLRRELNDLQRARSAVDVAQSAKSETVSRQKDIRREDAEHLKKDRRNLKETITSIKSLSLGEVIVAYREAGKVIAIAEQSAEDALLRLEIAGRRFKAVPIADVSDGMAEQIVKDLQQAQQFASDAQSDVERLKDALSGLNARKTAEHARLQGLSVDPENTAREARDVAWTHHKSVLDIGSAQAFEQRMKDADVVADRNMKFAGDIGAFEALERQCREAEEAHRDAELALKEAETGLGKKETRYRNLVKAFELPADMPVQEFSGWLKARSEADLASRKAEQVSTFHAEARKRGETARRALEELMTEPGALSTEEVIARGIKLAEDLEAQLGLTTGARRRLARVLREIRASSSVLKEAQHHLDEKAQTLYALMSRLLPAEKDAAWAENSIDVLDEISREVLLVQREETAAQRMRAAGQAYLSAFLDVPALVGGLSQDQQNRLSLSLGSEEVEVGSFTSNLQIALEAHEAADDAVIEARRGVLTRDKLLAEQEERETLLGQQKEAKATAENAVALYRERFSNRDDLASFEALEEAIARARHATGKREEKREVLQRIAKLLELPTGRTEADIEAAVAVREAEDTEVLIAAIAARGADRDLLSHARDTALTQVGRAENALSEVRQDDEAARLRSERDGLQQRVQDAVERFAQGKIGLYLARQAIDAFRKEHKSALMLSAGEAFEAITAGRYSDLTSLDEGGTEVLVATEGSSGIKRRASAMSSGTRVQLYFALRIAAYKDRLKTHKPLPLIVDDVFESFDDERTEAACGVLTDLSRHGQVIYLTHHRAAVESARAGSGDNVRVHDLKSGKYETL